MASVFPSSRNRWEEGRLVGLRWFQHLAVVSARRAVVTAIGAHSSGREPSNVDGEAAAATTSASIAVADGNAITSSDPR
jgi:hypothetical protein